MDVDESPRYRVTLGLACPIANYFSLAERLKSGLIQSAPYPYRTFSVPSTAFHLSCDPSCRIPIDEAAKAFNIPDLRPALADWLNQIKTGRGGLQAIGGRQRAPEMCQLPCNYLYIWFKVQIQSRR
jgi:hypothetical protein